MSNAWPPATRIIKASSHCTARSSRDTESAGAYEKSSGSTDVISFAIAK